MTINMMKELVLRNIASLVTQKLSDIAFLQYNSTHLYLIYKVYLLIINSYDAQEQCCSIDLLYEDVLIVKGYKHFILIARRLNSE